MRRTLALAFTGAAFLAAPPATAQTTSGAEGGAGTVENGGAAFGEVPPRPKPKPKPRRTAKRSSGRPVLTSFSVSPSRVFIYGHPARVRFQIDDRSDTVAVTLRAYREGERGPVATIDLGERPTGAPQSVRLDGFANGTALPQGALELRLSARDPGGKRLRTSARTSSVGRFSLYWHRFPLIGSFSYGGEGATFGSPRSGHSHQGQDLTAPSGTSVVAPRGGVVQNVAYQAGGAGYYVILDGEGEDRDYAFMHLLEGSIAVREGQRVRTGQLLGRVGSTGASSGPHLHFEVWEGGGWYEGGHPVDPLPYLRNWDSWS